MKRAAPARRASDKKGRCRAGFRIFRYQIVIRNLTIKDSIGTGRVLGRGW